MFHKKTNISQTNRNKFTKKQIYHKQIEISSQKNVPQLIGLTLLKKQMDHK